MPRCSDSPDICEVGYASLLVSAFASFLVKDFAVWAFATHFMLKKISAYAREV